MASDPRGNNGQVTYTLDNVGNRLQRTSTLPAIVPTGLLSYDENDRLSTDSYDPNGNTIQNSGQTNVYDFENRLVQRGGVTLVYDGDGNRVKETVAGVTTSYLVADQNPTGYAQVLDEIQNGAVTRTHSYGLELINERQTIAGTLTTSFYGYDGHGSVRLLTDSSGAVTDTYDYDAFGNLISSTGTTPNYYLFAGEQFDPALGIYYNRARYYDQRQGRFWTMDTFEGDPESPASLHKYLYANADPVDRIDPSGHDTPLLNIVRFLVRAGIATTTSLLGIDAHKLIQQDLQNEFPGTLTEYSIAGGRVDAIIPPNQAYEIKPVGGTVPPERQLDNYLSATNGIPDFPNGLVRGTIFVEKTIDGPYGLTDISYFTSRPGVIEYEVFPSVKLLVGAIAFVSLINTAQMFIGLGSTLALNAASPVPI